MNVVEDGIRDRMITKKSKNKTAEIAIRKTQDNLNKLSGIIEAKKVDRYTNSGEDVRRAVNNELSSAL